MEREIVCLLVYNISVSSRLSKFLVRFASEMLHRDQKRRSFDSEELKCEGVVKTKGQRAHVGHFCGTIFEASLETNRGKATVKFLVDDQDPEELMLCQDDELIIKGTQEDPPRNDRYRYN